MSKVIYPGQTIGIIGGGQLGRMMALAAKEAGFRVAVLDPAMDSPCGQVADIRIVAGYEDQEALAELAEVSDIITYEFENIDYAGLKKVMEYAYVPQGAELIRITQDRRIEKTEIEKAGVPVAPFAIVETVEDLHRGIEQLGYPVILKTARGGYDGKGQLKLTSEEDLQEAQKIVESVPCVLEKIIPFTTEISTIIHRNAAGESYILPIAENIHVNHILHQSIVPARVTNAIEKKAEQAAKAIAEHLELIGTLAVEMFVVEEDLIINELAPRPHNSGHYSIEACNVSQFHQHIRAICGWPLRKPRLWESSVMVNLLGQHVVPATNQLAKHPEWSLHLYGKHEAKENRKMGHITIMTDDMERTLFELEETTIWS